MTESQSIDTRRALRHPIVVEIEVTDQLSGIKIKDHTRDLSRFGCGVTTTTPFPAGTKVTLKIVYGNKKIVAFGQVMYGRADIGMGIAYTNIAPKDQELLEDLFGD